MSKVGFHHSEETKEKIRQAKIGTKMPPRSEEHRQKISEIHKGKIVSEETRQKQSEARKGKPSSRKGVVLSEETKQKIREANIGKKIPDEIKKRISETNKGRPAWNKGKRYKSKKCSSGDKNPNWKGGISKEEYSQHWTDDLKEVVRKRDNYMCQECGISQDELGGYLKKLDVHHIDYDKHNLDPINLISLCRSCHAKTSFNREYWQEYFEKNMESNNE